MKNNTKKLLIYIAVTLLCAIVSGAICGIVQVHASEYAPGDANGNGYIDVDDLVCILDYIGGMDYDTGVSAHPLVGNGDANENGSVNGTDVVVLRQKLVELFDMNGDETLTKIECDYVSVCVLNDYYNVRADHDYDGAITLNDYVVLLNYLEKEKITYGLCYPCPSCSQAAHQVEALVSSTYIDDIYHSQVWTCSGCSNNFTANMWHTNINDVCTACNYNFALPDESEIESDPGVLPDYSEFDINADGKITKIEGVFVNKCILADYYHVKADYTKNNSVDLDDWVKVLNYLSSIDCDYDLYYPCSCGASEHSELISSTYTDDTNHTQKWKCSGCSSTITYTAAHAYVAGACISCGNGEITETETETETDSDLEFDLDGLSILFVVALVVFVIAVVNRAKSK